MRIPILLCLVVAVCARAADWNPAVLAAIDAMPRSGGYAVSREAAAALRSAARVENGRLVVNPRAAKPSYCSGATYILLLEVVARAQAAGHIRLGEDVLRALIPAAQRDGQGAWGRWNANGPGTARWFHELELGKNFTSWDEARPGDFLKIFWRDAVGAHERGHLVVFLGRETRDGVEYVRFWSSNKPDGYGEKSVPRSQIARAIFSRLERPERLAEIGSMAATDPYLASLLERESSFEEACRLSGVGK